MYVCMSVQVLSVASFNFYIKMRYMHQLKYPEHEYVHMKGAYLVVL